MTNQPKRLLLFTAKLGYQTRSFEDAAQKLGVRLVYVTDRCHQLEDPWGDQAIAVHFESPEAAAYTVMETLRGQDVKGILALGDRPAVAAAYAARGLGLHFNHPAAVEACRSKLRMREVFREAGLRVPWFRHFPIDPAPEPVFFGISYPCVLKPLSLSASQGVVRANNSSVPYCSAREMPREHSACRTGRFTRNCESTRPACGRSKLRPGPSAGSVPAPYDSRLARRQNRSGSKKCFFAMRLNFPVAILHAKGLPPGC